MQFVEAGDVAMWVATASVECVPQTTRSFGARADRDGDRLWLFLPAEQSARALAHARPGAILAATFVRIHDYRAVQVKGEIASTHDGDDDDRRWVQRYRDAFAEANGRVGLPPELILGMIWWPCVAVEVVVRELYAQTPGPNAGAPL